MIVIVMSPPRWHRASTVNEPRSFIDARLVLRLPKTVSRCFFVESIAEAWFCFVAFVAAPKGSQLAVREGKRAATTWTVSFLIFFSIFHVPLTPQSLEPLPLFCIAVQRFPKEILGTLARRE